MRVIAHTERKSPPIHSKHATNAQWWIARRPSMALLTPSRRAVIGGLVAAPFILPGTLRAQTLGFVDYPFTLGVASGDGLPRGFVVLARLCALPAGLVIWPPRAPKPLEPQGGMPITPVAVDWEVAEDDGFSKVV